MGKNAEKDVLFSFHFAPDNWRAWNVRNSWVVQPEDQIGEGFFDGSVFEASKKESDDALKAFLRKGLENTSVTCLFLLGPKLGNVDGSGTKWQGA